MSKNEMEIITGGRQVSLANGQAIKVAEIKLRQIGEWQATESDDAGRIALVTGLTPEAIDELTHADIEAILAADEAVNAPFVRRREKAQQKKQAAQMEALKETMPDIYEQARAGMVEAMQAAMSGAASGSLPSSPSTSASQD